MVRRFVLVMTLAIAMAFAWSVPAYASVRSTLSLTGITGVGPKIAPVFTLQSYSWGSGYGSHTSGYSGRAAVKSESVGSGQLTISIASSKWMQSLMQAAALGRHFANGTLAAIRNGDASPYFQATFTDVYVVDARVNTRQGNSADPTASITFGYAGVTLQYSAPSNTCSIGRKTWLGFSHATPALGAGGGGTATDPLTEFLPLQIGDAGPGQVSVGGSSQADTLLTANGANGISNLRAQTLATRLNISAGGLDPTAVGAQLTQADTILGADTPSMWGSLDAGTQATITGLVNQLAGANTPATGCPLVPQVATLSPPQVPALAGIITDACTGAPVTGLQVSLDAPGLPGPIALATGTGEYTGPTVPAGTYTLTITGNGHNPFTLAGVQIPVQDPSIAGMSGVGIEISMSLIGGCAPGKNPLGAPQVPAFTGGLFDRCTLMSLNGGTMNLVPPAGGMVPTNPNDNWFTITDLAAGSYGISETVPGYTGVTTTGGTLPAVQMPAQPSPFADGSAARYAIIAVLEPAPVAGGC